MRPRTTLVLVALAVLAIGGAWYFGTGATPGTVAQPAAQLAFPGLAETLGVAARVEVIHGGQTTVLERRGAQWVSDAAAFYPVQPATLRAVLAGLTELRLAEPRTSDPTLLGRLGLDETSATLLRVLDGGGKPIAALLLGHRVVSPQPGMPEQIYVRRPEETQAWLAEGKVEIPADPAAWLDREIANFPAAQIKAADVEQGGQHLLFARASADAPVTLAAPADHPALDQYKLDDVFRAYEYLSFTAVRPAAQIPGSPAGTSVFATTDGTQLHAEVFRDGTDVWARFAASGPGGAALTARAAGWAYQIVAWKQNALVPTLDSLKSAPPEPAKPPAP